MWHQVKGLWASNSCHPQSSSLLPSSTSLELRKLGWSVEASNLTNNQSMITISFGISVILCLSTKLTDTTRQEELKRERKLAQHFSYALILKVLGLISQKNFTGHQNKFEKYNLILVDDSISRVARTTDEYMYNVGIEPSLHECLCPIVTNAPLPRIILLAQDQDVISICE